MEQKEGFWTREGEPGRYGQGSHVGRSRFDFQLRLRQTYHVFKGLGAASGSDRKRPWLPDLPIPKLTESIDLICPMPWDPTVLRKYNATGHFRLLNQLRSDLKGNPLIRPKQGETVGEANRSRSLIRAIEGRSSPAEARWRRQASALQEATSPTPRAVLEEDQDKGAGNSFRVRLNAIEMR